MADTINLPGLGKTKKTTAYLLGGGAVLVVGVAWYRARTVPAADSLPAADTSNEINPATGFPYGSEADLAALGQMAAIGGGPGLAFGGGDGSNTSGGSPPQGFATNHAWAQAAEDYLVNTVHDGNNADAIGNALGKYITGQPLSPPQVDYVTQAIAFTGYPPLNGPTGYPPSYRTAAAPPATPPSPGRPGKVTNLHRGKVTRTSIEIAWNRVAGATGYRVQALGASGWQSLATTTAGDTRHIHARLRPGSRHRYRVAAVNAAGAGPWTELTVTTGR